MLSMSYEKDWKKIEKNSLKKLENLNKGSTFAPATAKNVPKNTERKTEEMRRKKSFKIFQVLLAGNKKNF